MPNGATATLDGRLLQTVGGILLTICTAISGYTVTAVVENANRLTAIESSRYTSEASARDQAKVADAIRGVWKEIASIREDLAGRPRVRPDDLQDIKTRLALIEQTLRELKEKK